MHIYVSIIFYFKHKKLELNKKEIIGSHCGKLRSRGLSYAMHLSGGYILSGADRFHLHSRDNNFQWL